MIWLTESIILFRNKIYEKRNLSDFALFKSDRYRAQLVIGYSNIWLYEVHLVEALSFRTFAYKYSISFANPKYG